MKNIKEQIESTDSIDRIVESLIGKEEINEGMEPGAFLKSKGPGVMSNIESKVTTASTVLRDFLQKYVKAGGDKKSKDFKKYDTAYRKMVDLSLILGKIK